jgi:hypothetical protein
VSEIVAKRIGSNPLSGVRNLRLHWPEYLMEAGERACGIATCWYARWFQMKNRISDLLMETTGSHNRQRLHKVKCFCELLATN